MSTHSRRFLFLQGPHGPFFSQLAQALRRSGSQVWRVGFNAGDRAFCTNKAFYIPMTAPMTDWPKQVQTLLERHQITDLVLYGDTRPHHAQAILAAKARGLHVHVFEEGYLRPYWVTYERDGSNGNSKFMHFRMPQILRADQHTLTDSAQPPASWGALRQHIFYGALYHGHILFRNSAYPHYRSHRQASPWAETRAYFGQLFRLPFHAARRWWMTRELRDSGQPYHIVLLQLDHDANFLQHGPFANNAQFIETVTRAFARAAPPHHRLVFKAHPLEPQTHAQRRCVNRIARTEGVGARVRHLPGGKLANVLDHARSAITVTSTAGQQALWRGIPTRCFGACIYAGPMLTSDQALEDFFMNPQQPNTEAYRALRRVLLATSQIPGSYYTKRGRAQVLRLIVDAIYAPRGPYDKITALTTPPE